MTMMEHLRELRSRVIRSALAVCVGASLVLVFYEEVLRFLTEPYRNLCKSRPDFNCDGSLFALGPLDGFAARLRVATYGGIIVALPVIMWQIWRFIVPALERRERRYAVPFIFSTLVLFATGAYLAYWTLDKALEFLISWSGDEVNQAYQINQYVNLISLMALAFGIGFLSPVLIVFLQLVGVISPKTLLKQWRFAVMTIFVVAGVITPSGDPVSLLALSIPMTVLYMLAIGIGWLVLRRREKDAVERQ